jgi:HEAT repeat protein
MADVEANFKKGSLGIKFVLLAIGIAVLAIGLVYVGIKREGEKLTIEQVVNEQKRIFKLPKQEQIPEWRKWASSTHEFEMQQQALLQLAWLDDKESIPIVIKALEQNDRRIRGVAAQVAAHFGSPAADPAKPAIVKALTESDASDEPQLAWALVELREQPALDRILSVYRAGHLAKVQRVGGGGAFDPEKLAKMATPDQWVSYAKDDSASVRQLVATILSTNADPKFTDTLIGLVQDDDVDVAREAAPGLGRIGDDKARKPLLDALGKADKESRKKFLAALRDGIGGVGLVMALDAVDKTKPETTWHQTRVVFNLLKELADPRAGDALVAYIEKGPQRHWKTEAAMRLAEVGDPRAVPYLAERMMLNTVKIYGDSELIEEKALARGDEERIVGARMLADLAKLHPDKIDTFRDQAEDAVLFWISDMPQPHANALRFLAHVNSAKARTKLRDWSFPTAALPREGQQPPMPQEWVVAQSALRYLGVMKDEPSWGKFETHLKRRKADTEDIDATMQSLMGGGLAILGMSLRAIGVGVADGFTEWGDTRAYKPLVEYIEDPKENEQSRMQACFALGWVTPADKAKDIPEKITKFATTGDEKDQFIAGCYSETLARRSIPEANGELIKLLTPDMAPMLRLNIAQAIGFAGVRPEDEQPLFDLLANPEVRNNAALALVVGGSEDAASRAVAAYGDFPEEALDSLRSDYFRVFGYWSTKDFEEGRLYRFVRNAEALRRIRVRKAPQEWAMFLLGRQFDNLQFDNGPHSMTRVVLRYKLRNAAMTGDPTVRAGALETLRFMREQGVLMDLKQQGGDVGKQAGEALFLLMNPKVVIDVEAPDVKTGGSKILPSNQ